MSKKLLCAVLNVIAVLGVITANAMFAGAAATAPVLQVNKVFKNVFIIKNGSFAAADTAEAIGSEEAQDLQKKFSRAYSNDMAGVYLEEYTAQIAVKPLDGVSLEVKLYNPERNTIKTLQLSKTDKKGYHIFAVPEDAKAPLNIIAANGKLTTEKTAEAEALKTWTHTAIEGDGAFTENTRAALVLIKESDTADEIVNNYVGVIKQGKTSGMAAQQTPPTFVVGEASYEASLTWYASAIVHDAYHSKLYHDYLKNHDYVPYNVWTGEEAEMACLEVQIEFLEEIGAPEYEIDYAESLIGDNWRDEERWWSVHLTA
jgi:hypothetical protein